MKDEPLSLLMDMGLSKQEATVALERAGNNVENALALHFGDPTQTPVDSESEDFLTFLYRFHGTGSYAT